MDPFTLDQWVMTILAFILGLVLGGYLFASTKWKRRYRDEARRTAELWPAVRPIIRIGRDASVVDPDLPDLVERWLEEAIADIEDGLTAAGRLEPHQRHFRGVLAMAELDYVAQHWDGSDWKIGRDQMIEELAASWVRLLN